MRIRPMGPGGALCVLETGISPDISRAVARLDEQVRKSAPAWLTETVPAYASLLVRFDPLLASYGRVKRELRAAERRSRAQNSGEERPSRTFEIPVCYGGEYGPDLSFVAEHAGVSEEEAVRLHSEKAYHIYMLGFLPGFCYLGGLDEKLETPRLATPRARIPAGSVGIGGKQTGIYPLDSPGGWRLIGRTPLRLFDPSSPLPYRAGDGIRFRPITPEEYAAYEKDDGHGR